MKDMIKVSWYIILTTMVLTMLVFATAKVFAHGEGRCFRSATFFRNGNFVKVVDHLEPKELEGRQGGVYKHGHENQYYNRNGNPTTPSTSFFNDAHEDFYVDCSTFSPTPTPTSTPTPATVTRTPETSARSTVSQQYVGTYYPYPRIVRKPPVEVAPPCKEIDLQEFLWHGETMLGLRLLPQGVETISDLWNAWDLSTEKGNKINVFLGGWCTYDDVTPFHQGAGDIPLSPNMGLVIEQTIGNLINIEGCPVENSQKIWIQEGDNLIGFPEVPDLFELPSDFLSDKITSVKVQVGTPWGAMYHTINTEGDEGDVLLRAGQAVILTSTEFHSVNLSEPPPAAPMAPRRGTLTTSWGAMKERR